MSDKIVSFIIPAYNAADTIVRCLESIYVLSLKREEFEVIVIDDASVDNTVEIVEAYSQSLLKGKSLQNLKLLKQPENHRQGAARNRGVGVAKGEFICFVDADDAVLEGIVNAIRMANEMQTDMLPYHLAYTDAKGCLTKEEVKLIVKEGQLFTGIEMQNKHPYWCSAPWGYIYGCMFLKRVNYPFAEDVLYEDSDFVAAHLYHAERMAYSRELGYLAYERGGSTTRSINYKNAADYLLLGVRMLWLYERITNESIMSERERFAESILEGACWNVQKSCRMLIKLDCAAELIAFYTRIDSQINRKTICEDKRFRKCYCNAWTSLCLMHKRLTMVILAVLIPVYKLVTRWFLR